MKGYVLVEIGNLGGHFDKVKIPEWYSLENTWLPANSIALGPITSDDPKSSTAIGDDVYFFINTKQYKYNTKSNSWTSIDASTPSSFKTGVTPVANNNLIYLGGGLEDYSSDRKNGSKQFLCFDPNNKTFTTKADMITGLQLMLMCSYKDQIYVFGGSSYREYYSGTYSYGYVSNSSVYNPVTNTWTTKTKPSFYKICKPVVMGDFAYLLGTAGSSYDNNKYDFNTDTYTALPGGRTSAVSYAVHENRIYAISTTTSMYIEASGTWTEKASPPVDRTKSSCHSINGNIYSILGTSSNKNGDVYVPD